MSAGLSPNPEFGLGRVGSLTPELYTFALVITASRTPPTPQQRNIGDIEVEL
jgi:hypothetical protein